MDLLRSRGLTFDDESKAKQFLLYNNYYRISGYSLTLRSNDRFFDSASFQNIIDIYCFDQEFRHIILQYLEIIEVKFKSIYAYEFTKAHGPTGHLDKQNFTNEQKYNDIIDKSELQKNHRLPHEAKAAEGISADYILILLFCSYSSSITNPRLYTCLLCTRSVCIIML